MRHTFASLSLCIGLVVGCASAPPPRPLVDARASYQKARMGKAAELAPAELHTAKVTLNRAEQSYEEDAESAETYALSYVALRTVQLVESQANAKSSQRDFDQAQQEIDRIEADDMARTRNELARAKQLLSERDKEIAVKGQQIASTSAQLESTSAQLEAERLARAAAEEREREAMRKLAEAAALNVREESRGTVIILPGNVLFESGKHALTPGAQGKLMLVAQTLVPEAQNHTYLVEGHTDSRGSRDVNQELSENRARVVMDYLIIQGIPASSIRSVGIGPDRPMADNNTGDGRAQNRRVEIVVGRAEPK